jgi:hypothetical protein
VLFTIPLQQEAEMTTAIHKIDPIKKVDDAIAQTAACLLELTALKMEIEKELKKPKLVRVK